MTDMTREEALAHFGVKGMRWGVRKASINKSYKEAKSKTPKLSDKQKQAAKISSVVAVGVGAAAATYILGKNSGVKLSDAKAAVRIENGQNLITKSLKWDAAYKPDTLYRFTPSEINYIDFIIKDTFKNRV